MEPKAVMLGYEKRVVIGNVTPNGCRTGRINLELDPSQTFCRIWGKRAGRLLDGQIWDQRPEVIPCEHAD